MDFDAGNVSQPRPSIVAKRGIASERQRECDEIACKRSFASVHRTVLGTRRRIAASAQVNFSAIERYPLWRHPRHRG
jgi:hypothetical protein